MSSVTKVIDGIEFTVAPMQAIKALRLQRELAFIIAPSIGSLVGGMDKIEDLKNFANINLTGTVINEAFASALDRLPEDKFIGLIQKLLNGTLARIELDGSPRIVHFGGEGTFEAQFQMVFLGQLKTMYKVIFMVLEANYPDMLGKLKQPTGDLTPITDGIESVTAEAKKGWRSLVK